MIVGIDLDNTIINYNLAFEKALKVFKLKNQKFSFSSNPVENKEYLRRSIIKKRGIKLWQKIQGQVYGNLLLKNALIFPGVKRFIWRCKQRNNKVYIISHKTKYGAFDKKKVLLREVAKKFLKKQGILGGNSFSVDGIFFANDGESKAQIINKLGVDYFIDDLKVFINFFDNYKKNFRKRKTHLIHFNYKAQSKHNKNLSSKTKTLSSWHEIDLLINKFWTKKEIIKISSNVIKKKLLKASLITKGGNSALYKLFFPQKVYKLKFYPIDVEHDRLLSEINANNILQKINKNNFSKMLKFDRDLGYALYEWHSGKKIVQPTLKDIDFAINFIKALNKIKMKNFSKKINFSKDSCLNVIEIKKRIELKIKTLDRAKKKNLRLKKFLQKKFKPLLKKIFIYCKKKWEMKKGFFDNIERKDQSLCPMDFGFHNCIKKENKLIFFDFEYFGWDDPARLISDFIYHPRMKLTNYQVKYWIDKTCHFYGHTTKKRFNLVRYLHGLFWCLILLNDFVDKDWAKRVFANRNKKIFRNSVLHNQLEKAEKLFEKINFQFNEIKNG